MRDPNKECARAQHGVHSAASDYRGWILLFLLGHLGGHLGISTLGSWYRAGERPANIWPLLNPPTVPSLENVETYHVSHTISHDQI